MIVKKTRIEDLPPELVAPLRMTNAIVLAYLAALDFIIRDTRRDPTCLDNQLPPKRDHEAGCRIPCRSRDIPAGRLRNQRGRSLQRDGDRVVYSGSARLPPFFKLEEFLDFLYE
ncbi:hypothetical protein AYJ54_24540 [Bradyrhizobium centrolobii]|uniref:Uncharacterized protein n=1 Tax=Bradyrhizobium centrolobii TaxID=1505087 RepID=A0A176YEF5_9BRAD|nr:hypothetical protein AYJ54_24540 [Bradyrhizobium centrolobii]